MHVSPLLVHVLLMGHVVERIMSTKGMSVPYNCMGSQMAQTGTIVLIVYYKIAHD